MYVALHNVCWIPKYRTLDCGEGNKELLTISGPTVRSSHRGYMLAVVQKLRSRGQVTEVESVILRVIVEQDLWKYQNLTALPDGERRIKNLFRQSLGSIRPATFSDDDTDGKSETPSSIEETATETGSSRNVSLTPLSTNSEGASLGININFSLDEGADDQHVDRRRLELKRKVMAGLAKAPASIINGPVRPYVPGLGFKKQSC